VKLSKVKHLPKRTELNTSSSRRTALELFGYICVYFLYKVARFDRIEPQLPNELNMMHSDDEDIEFDRFDRTKLLTKNKKLIKKFRNVGKSSIVSLYYI
jgi:hypothetical protein